MSSRFNPVALLTRRRSKSKSKSQSESSTAAGVTTPTGSRPSPPESQQPLEPRVTSKPARTSAPSDTPSSPKVRFRVFASLRRARSPRRRSEKEACETTRAISVPPKIRTGEQTVPIDVPIPPSIQKLNDEIQSNESAAPLAQHDCFELTDVSDAEHEDLQSKRQRLTTEQSNSIDSKASATHRIESAHISSSTETLDSRENKHPASSFSKEEQQQQQQQQRQQHVQQNEPVSLSRSSTQSLDEENAAARTSTDTEDDMEDEDTWQTERLNRSDTVDSVEDSSVTKLSVEYETEYPVCENTDSTLSPPQSPLGKDWADLPDDGQRNSSDTDDAYDVGGRVSNGSPSLSNKSFEDEEVQGDGTVIHSETEPTTEPSYPYGYDQTVRGGPPETGKCDVQVNVIPADSESDQYPDEESAQPQVDETIKTDYEQDQTVTTDQDEYMEPQFEVEPDPEQDPFYAAELAATELDNQDGVLSAPSIIVTSASTGSLHLIAESEPPPPTPERPPPPVAVAQPSPPSGSEDTAPKRPPPPPVGPPSTTGPPPPRPPPSRPPGSPAQEQTPQHQKKKKLFGVVDLGKSLF
ncbi:unnamed protein product [Echinostoma caproni]|uniref:Protein transport protein sec16 n=1 Tax=Echinostoma caproni TaxID=27848 RepID=A0A183AAR9_9TREM|nr:unnamed protein product [Echinostoma caproni]